MMFRHNIYWDENVSHCAPQGILLCTGKLSLLYYPGVFYQLLYTNKYFPDKTLVLSHIHTSLTVPFSSLNICLSDQEFGYLSSLKYLNE